MRRNYTASAALSGLMPSAPADAPACESPHGMRRNISAATLCELRRREQLAMHKSEAALRFDLELKQRYYANPHGLCVPPPPPDEPEAPDGFAQLAQAAQLGGRVVQRRSLALRRLSHLAQLPQLLHRVGLRHRWRLLRGGLGQRRRQRTLGGRLGGGARAEDGQHTGDSARAGRGRMR